MQSSTSPPSEVIGSATLLRQSSIRKRLFQGFIAVGLVIACGLAAILTQVSSLISYGDEVKSTYQPVKMHTSALIGGLQHSVAIMRQGVTGANTDFVKQSDEAWQKEVQVLADSVKLYAEQWPETPKKQQAFELLDQIKTLRITLDNAKTLTETVELTDQDLSRRATLDTTGEASSTEVIKDAINITYRPQLAGFLNEKVIPAQQQIQTLALSLMQANQKDIDAFGEKADRKKTFLQFTIAGVLLLLGITIAMAIRLILQRIKQNLDGLNAQIGNLAKGMLLDKLEATDAELKTITDSVNELTDNLRSIKDFAQHVGQGNFDNEIKVFNDAGDLGQSLARMRDGLKQVSEQDKIRYWTNEGLATFGEILRGNSDDLKTLSDQLVSQLVKYMNANQGGIFVLNKEDQQQPVMELSACYAYNRKKHLKKAVLPGEGLVGQAWQEADTIYLREIPQSYVQITSGLGGANPKYLLIVPLKLNGEVYGVIELASFHDFERYKIDFTEKIAESIASTIAGARVTEQTKQLLGEAQEMTEEMRAQEEEMRQNMEELQATQEEMHRSQRETTDKLKSAEKENELLRKKIQELESKK